MIDENKQDCRLLQRRDISYSSDACNGGFSMFELQATEGYMSFAIERNGFSTVAADAIFIAANERLQITGGVGLTVALSAGLQEVRVACDEVGFCPCGSAVATSAFNLNAEITVHAVGPVWQGGGLGEADFLRTNGIASNCILDDGE